MKLIPIIDKHITPINPVQFGYQNCENSHSFGPAIRTHWLIHYVVSGCGIFKKDEKEYKVSQGEMFVIPPWCETYYEADSETPWSYIWIGFEAENLPIPLDDKITCPKASSVFRDMKRCEEFESGRNLFLVSKIWEMFSLIENLNSEKSGYVDSAKSFIRSQYMLGIGVEEIARHVGLNRSYFSDIFKKGTGKSPVRYLMEYRMNVAHSLLTESKTSVATAAHSVGYTDVFIFSKAFKKYWGYSPIQCKK